VYWSVFRRSKKADISIHHTIYFSFLDNYSEGSRAFFLADRAPNWKDSHTHGANMTLQRNTIVNPADTACIRVRTGSATATAAPSARPPIAAMSLRADARAFRPMSR